MKKALVILALMLAGCCSKRELAPAVGQTLPAKPYGATATPTPDQLLTADTQARPRRSDEVLKDSREREGDTFDLPPPN